MAKDSRDFDIPEAVAAPKRQWSPQLVWLIPIVAVLVGGWLAVTAILQRGPTATISFKTAESLEAGKTKIKYKDVDIGEVTGIALTEDRSRIIVTAQFVKEAASFLVDGTNFWVVRPQIGAGGISGLGTLFSGAYIGVDPGSSSEPRREFTGLETAPVVTMDQPGRQFVLRSADLASLDAGTPVYFRRAKVGQVIAANLNPDGTGATVKVFVAAPYDKFVTPETRFWHASGIDITLNASGIQVDTQSLGSIILGGIAFQTRPDSPVLPPAEANAVFTLHPNRAQAMKLPDTKTAIYTVLFDESLRGLEVGAPVDFRGVVVGEVTGVGILIEAGRIRMRADVNVHANRLEMRATSAAQVALLPTDRKARLDLLVARGLRAQIKTGNLLTGQLYVALDFFPEAPPATVNWTTDPPQVPTVPGGLQELQAMLHRVAAKLEKVPIDKIGTDLHETLQSFDKLAKRLDAEVAPEARLTLEEARRTLGTAERTFRSDAPLQQDTRETLRELSRTAQSLRVLADYLERHPEALIRGKKDQKP
jgi:paraquat-inducible protein B